MASSCHPPRAAAAPVPIHAARGSWGGNDNRRAASAMDMAGSQPNLPMQPLHMHSMSNASTPRARSVGPPMSRSGSPRSTGINQSPGDAAATGFAGPQGVPLGAGSAARNVTSWSGVPGTHEGHHAVPFGGHRRQVSESALAGNAAHGNLGSTAATDTTAAVSKGWLGGLAARLMPGSSSKDSVAGMSGSNSDSDLSHSGKPPVAPMSQGYSYSSLAPPPATGAWGEGAGVVQSDPRLPPSNTSAPAWGSRSNSASQWPAAPAGNWGQTGAPTGAAGPQAPHAGPPPGSFFSTTAPTAGSVMHPGAPSGNIPVQYEPQGAQGVFGQQQYAQHQYLSLIHI